MAARYASGKYALGHCDRCDFPCPLNDMKTEWNGTKVCPECFEPKHPQLKVRRHQADAEALKDPRPGTDVNNRGQGAPVIPWTFGMAKPPFGGIPVGGVSAHAWDTGDTWDTNGKYQD